MSISLSNTKSVPSKWNCQTRPAQIPPSQKAKKKLPKVLEQNPKNQLFHFDELISSAFWGGYRMHDHYYYYYLHCMISNKLRTYFLDSRLISLCSHTSRTNSLWTRRHLLKKDKGSYTYTSKIGGKLWLSIGVCMIPPPLLRNKLRTLFLSLKLSLFFSYIFFDEFFCAKHQS
jgi:hypothetical protein